ncbi:uncharacterized protein J7T54_004925 [Emericellopsis cladophorae]|uniref:Uncharacterized protein n=1 Tax=Emericellopsis cladophorae TaxID=2686198 RepID=A0A9Q0BEZ5_9HYPO|nr:uncharacterized protein J7T54_004925 [Emericellopsis cladophorae]KAI6781759.1 hypothetical protein J7T54_004925 [Emericellopsis cladophorae]
MAAPFQPRVDATLMATKSSTAAIAYLRGRVPEGVDPSSVRDTDYVYDRALTSDELRARHMYWGKAPAELQQGLPKFNGKDFFRTSPGGQHARPVISSDPFEGLSQTATVLTRNGPGFSTQSESLPRPGQGSSEDHEELTVTTNRTNANSTRIGRSMEELNRGSHDTPPTSSGSVREKSSAEETTDDDREILYTGRKNMVKIGQRMLPNVIKSSTGSNASISSTTAQGLLPNYSGHATASLTPSITNRMFSNLRNTSKIGLDEARLAGVTTTKSGENCPPSVNVDDIF